MGYGLPSASAATLGTKMFSGGGASTGPFAKTARNALSSFLLSASRSDFLFRLVSSAGQLWVMGETKMPHIKGHLISLVEFTKGGVHNRHHPAADPRN